MNIFKAIWYAFFSVKRPILDQRPDVSSGCRHDWRKNQEKCWGRLDHFDCAKCGAEHTHVWDETAY